ncbi:hypothetical protein [Streptomyces sp. NPDC003015]
MKPASASVPVDSAGDRVDDLVDSPPTARTAKIREWQALAWLQHGGLTHSKRIVDAAQDISHAYTAAVQKPRDNGKIMLETKKFSRLCGALAKQADDALAYFPVPDKKLQKTWPVTLKGIARQGRICQDAMTPGDDDPYTTEADRARAFDQALDEIFDALDSLGSMMEEITKVATSST